MSGFSFYFRPVDGNVHGDDRVGYTGNGYESGGKSGDGDDERGDLSGDAVRSGFRSQYTNHY